MIMFENVAEPGLMSNFAFAPVLVSVKLPSVVDIAPLAVNVVNEPAAAVVAPTVPLMFIEAVPVRFVTTPLLGVPKAGVTKTGLVRVLLVSVCTSSRVTACSAG